MLKRYSHHADISIVFLLIVKRLRLNSINVRVDFINVKKNSLTHIYFESYGKIVHIYIYHAQCDSLLNKLIIFS